MIDPSYRAAMDEQADLLRFWGSDLGARMGIAWVAVADRLVGVAAAQGPEEAMALALEREVAGEGGAPATAEEEASGLRLRDMVVAVMKHADPVVVSSDVFQLIDEARHDFRPEPLLPSDLFTPDGFMLFPRSFRLVDARNDSAYVRALAWTTVTTNIKGDVVRAEPGKPRSGAAPAGVWVVPFQHREDPESDYPLVAARSREAIQDPTLPDLTPLHFGHLAFGGPPKGPASDLEVLLSVIWRFAAQVVRVHVKPHRAARRSAARAGVVAGDTTVLTLRRGTTGPHDGGEHEDAHYSHRFIVRGHWRNQWYSSLDTHRQIWIAPFLKGPDDLPLLSKGRAFRLVR